MTDTLTAFIFARGGSKGLPGKNIRLLAGKPLIGWAIETAFAMPAIGRVVVSTDCEEIARIAKSFGADVPFARPAELASDNTSEWEAWRHALTAIRERDGFLPEPFISVPTTSPLRTKDDVEACLKEFKSGGADVVLAVSQSHRNPWFNMVAKGGDGLVSLVNNASGSVKRRQDAPTVYDLTTVAYVADPGFVLQHEGIFAGRVRAVEVPVERSIDIDTPHDFAIAEFLMNRRLENDK